MHSKTLKATCVAAALVAAACRENSGPTQANVALNPVVPSLTSAVAGAPPNNVLAVTVSFDATGADSVRAVYQASNGSAEATPFHAAQSGLDSILVLGLRPTTLYQIRIEAVTSGRSETSAATAIRTSALPDDIAGLSLRALTGRPTRPYAATGIFTGTAGYAVIFDSTGTVVWYRSFASTGLPVSDVAMQPNGNFTAYIGASHGWEPQNGYYVEITPRGDIMHTFDAPGGYWADGHEMLLTGSGASARAHFLTYDLRDMDLSSYDGPASAMVAGHQVVRTDMEGNVEWSWNAWDHLAITDKIGEESPANLANTDYDHPNAITFDRDGNYVVSWRDLNQIIGIDSKTGAVLWKLGGTRGEYRFVNDPKNGFSKQHYARILSNGNLLLFDNGFDGTPQESRAVEYKLDHTAKTATMVWEYRHSPALFSRFVGNVNRLSNDNTWVGFGLVGEVTEVSHAGNVIWDAQLEISGTNWSAYRIVPVVSLYSYVAP
jgi:hypothetical protein